MYAVSLISKMLVAVRSARCKPCCGPCLLLLPSWRPPYCQPPPPCPPPPGAPHPVVRRAGHLQAHAAAGPAPRDHHPGLGCQPALPALPDGQPCCAAVVAGWLGRTGSHCAVSCRGRPAAAASACGPDGGALKLAPRSLSHQGGVKAFLSCLRQHAPLVRSADDPHTWLVNDTGDPLQRSLW